MNSKTKGRPKGATSFVNVSMADLAARFGSTQAIPVSRIWLRNLGIEFQEAQTSVVTAQPEATADTKIEMSITE